MILGNGALEWLLAGPVDPFSLGPRWEGHLDFLVAALIASAARRGVVLQEAISSTSAIDVAKCDAVLIAMDFTPGDAEASRRDVAAAFDLIQAMRTGIGTKAGL
jgi:hypothetical protein